MILKCVLFVLLLVVLFALGKALWHWLMPGQAPERMARALTWRIGLSLVVFALLVGAFSAGVLRPHGLAMTGTAIGER